MALKKLSRSAFFRSGLATAAGVGMIASLFGARPAAAAGAKAGKGGRSAVKPASRTVVRPEGLR